MDNMDSNILTLDASRIACFMECRKKYWLRYVRHLKPIRRSTAPAFGTAIHSALDSWYMDKDVDKAWEVFCSEYKDSPEDALRTRAKARQVLKEYDKHYRDLRIEVLEVEYGFQIMDDEIEGLMLEGRIDKVIDWEGAVYGMDHKTTRSIGIYYFNGFRNNVQIDMYMMILRKMFPQVLGIIIDAIQIAKTKGDFMRDVAERNKGDIDGFRRVLKQVVYEIKEIMGKGDTDWWCPNYGACANWGGCAYMKACIESDDRCFEAVLGDREMFVVEKWSPIKDTKIIN